MAKAQLASRISDIISHRQRVGNKIMEPDALCQEIGQWFRKHKEEEPFAFGEIHLLTGELKADILLIIGKMASETKDRHAFEKQWENTIYDHPVTWLWQKLADEEADTWLRHIYEEAFYDKKKHMLEALLELAVLVESHGYEITWEAKEPEVFLTEIPINWVEEKSRSETERWQTLLRKHVQA